MSIIIQIDIWNDVPQIIYVQLRECLIYIDDIIVPGKTVENTLSRLEHVFMRRQAANLKLKPCKCSLFQRKLKY